MNTNSKIRNPGLVLLLSRVTCGIYSWYLIYTISNEVKEFTGDANINPVLELVLCLITCGIYPIYWYYKYSRLVFGMQQTAGVAVPNDISIITLILTLIGLGVISMLLLQTELNKVWETQNV